MPQHNPTEPLKQFRRVATHYEKRAVYDLAVFTLASIVPWL